MIGFIFRGVWIFWWVQIVGIETDIVDTDFEYRLKPLKTEIDIETENEIEEN